MGIAPARNRGVPGPDSRCRPETVMFRAPIHVAGPKPWCFAPRWALPPRETVMFRAPIHVAGPKP